MMELAEFPSIAGGAAAYTGRIVLRTYLSEPQRVGFAWGLYKGAVTETQQGELVLFVATKRGAWWSKKMGYKQEAIHSNYKFISFGGGFAYVATHKCTSDALLDKHWSVM